MQHLTLFFSNCLFHRQLFILNCKVNNPVFEILLSSQVSKTELTILTNMLLWTPSFTSLGCMSAPWAWESLGCFLPPTVFSFPHMIQVAPIFLCGVGWMSMRQALIKNPSLTTNLFSPLLKSIVYKRFLTFIACYHSLPINFYGYISVCVSSIFIHSSGSD